MVCVSAGLLDITAGSIKRPTPKDPNRPENHYHCLSVCWTGELYKTSAAAQGPKLPENLTAIDPRQAVLLHAEVFQPPQQRQSAAERRHLVAGHVETSQRRDRVGRRQVATDGPCRRLTTAATIRCHDLLWHPSPSSIAGLYI